MDIVVAIDLNADPAAVVDPAVGWATHLRAKLHLRTVSALRFRPDEVFGAEGQALVAEWDRVRRAEVDTALRLMERVPVPLRGTAEVLEGSPAGAIAAAALQADLVLCATHGRTGLARLVLGSTCEAIVHASSKPTLVLRLGAERSRPRVERVMVPIDPAAPTPEALLVVSRWFPRASITLLAVLERVVRLGGRELLGAPCTVHNHPGRDQAAATLRDLLARTGVDGRVRLVMDEAVGTGAAIAAAAADHDLVAMTTHRRHGVVHLWWGSVAQHVARLSTVPTLVCAVSGR